MNKNLIWVIGIIIIVSILCGTLIHINNNSWTLRIEMDNNTKEAIQSINYSQIYNNKVCYSEKCYLDLKKNQIGSCSMVKVNCDLFNNKYGGLE